MTLCTEVLKEEKDRTDMKKTDERQGVVYKKEDKKTVGRMEGWRKMREWMERTRDVKNA